MKELRQMGSNKRENRITVRLTPDELDIVEEAAKIAKQELAAYVRQEVVEAAQSFIRWAEVSNQSRRRFRAIAPHI